MMFVLVAVAINILTKMNVLMYVQKDTGDQKQIKNVIDVTHLVKLVIMKMNHLELINVNLVLKELIYIKVHVVLFVQQVITKTIKLINVNHVNNLHVFIVLVTNKELVQNVKEVSI